MRRVLFILTRPPTGLAAEWARETGEMPGFRMETVDLTEGDPDYHALLDRLDRADSVQVW